MSLETTSCLYCGFDETSLLCEGQDRLTEREEIFGVVRCERCDFVYTSPRPPVEELGIYYPDEYEPHAKVKRLKPPRTIDGLILELFYGYPIGKTKSWSGWKKRLVRTLLLPFYWKYRGRTRNLYRVPFHGKGRILDVGCGRGDRLAFLDLCGWEVTGIDFSEEAARFGREEYGIDIRTGDLLDEGFPDGSFDVVTMWHALEHMPDPLATLREIDRILVPGGKLVVCVPSIDNPVFRRLKEDWFGLELPRHLSHFTPRSLPRLMRKAGFRTGPVRHDRSGHVFVFSLNHLAERSDSGLLSFLVKRKWLMKWLMKMVGRFEAWFGCSEIIVCTATKPEATAREPARSIEDQTVA